MVGIFWVAGLFFVFSSILISNVNYAMIAHREHMIDRAMKYAMIESFEKDNIDDVFESFESSFLKLCPQNLEYEVVLMNLEIQPKLVHFLVNVSDEAGETYIFEEVLIEEVIHDS